jgi:chemotaxis signal transduction protein
MTLQDNMTEYVTAVIGGQLFGVPITRVQDVFVPDRLTQVPLAPPEIAGLLNVRGRILTVVNSGNGSTWNAKRPATDNWRSGSSCMVNPTDC